MAEAPRELSLISEKSKASPSLLEFIIILSMMMSLTALSIDSMLPALPQIGHDLGIANPNAMAASMLVGNHRIILPAIRATKYIEPIPVRSETAR